MAAARPRIVVTAHDVAVGAGLRIVGDVRITARVDERVGTQAGGDAHDQRNRDQ
jgi:hypothetical protein